jgi:putative redox protein
MVWQGGLMATESTHRTLTVERVAPGQFEAVNSRGGRIVFGTGGGDSFTPTELLLIAIGGCTAIDVDILTSRRAEPESFEINVDADKVRDEGGNRLTNIEVTYRLRFPAGEAGDAARAVLPDAVQRSHDRLCTVGRTVELPTPISTRID